MGLISKGEYSNLPDWLRIVLMSGAQYYYEVVCLTNNICSNKNDRDFRLGLFNHMVERASIGVDAINQMQKYIDKLIPSWYAESPASLNDSDFLY